MELGLGEINQDDVGIVPQAIEHDLFAVRRDVEGSHRGANVETGQGARFFRGEIERPEILPRTLSLHVNRASPVGQKAVRVSDVGRNRLDGSISCP
jgi:hypothetical protein